MTGITEFPFLRNGDLVTYGSYPQVYKITRVKQVKALATESGTGRRVELRIQHCKPAPEGTVFVEDESTPKVATPSLGLGMAVRFREPNHKTVGVWVTLTLNSSGWRLARLGGGDGMRYLYGVDADRLVPIDAINNADWSGAL